MNRISLVLASLMLSAAPLAANATGYIQNQMTDQSLTVQYQYCIYEPNFKCSALITSPEIKPQSAYQIPNAAGPVKYVLVQVVSASTPDGWSFTGPDGQCSPWIDSGTPSFANFTKSYVQNVLQCSGSVGSAK